MKDAFVVCRALNGLMRSALELTQQTTVTSYVISVPVKLYFHD
jgi:hypothetical protein